ncbi:MAG: HAD family hydrolase [Rhodobacteraceae bacterium]|nr:HAD family hydrolase [Paracoccaceae bacterium]
MRFRGILFDKDGTLFDFQATWANWMSNALSAASGGDDERARCAGAELGFDYDAGRFDAGSAFVTGTPEVSLNVFARHFPELGQERLMRILRGSGSESVQTPPVPLPPLLDGLRRQGFELGVVTNDWSSSAEAQLRAAGCLEYFGFLVGSDSGFGSKPDPEMLLAFCAATDIEPGQCLMVGDSPVDMLAGQRAGMTTVAVLTGTDDRDVLAPLADAVLPDIGAIPDWIDAA